MRPRPRVRPILTTGMTQNSAKLFFYLYLYIYIYNNNNNNNDSSCSDSEIYNVELEEECDNS